MRSAPLRAGLLLPAIIFACAAPAPTSARGSAPSPEGAAVRIVLGSPRDIHVVDPSGKTVLLRNVRELVGRAEFMRHDTLELAVSGARSSGERVTSVKGLVRLPANDDMQITVLSRSPRVMNAVGAAALPGLVAAGVIWFWWAMSGSST